jgi:polyhydroxyalkanoate synthesis regulator phasin
MFDLVKKTLLAGVGLTLMTKDKVEELARDVAKSAQLSADKGQEFVEEAVARAKKGREELDALVQRTVNDAVKKANLASREDIVRLGARLEKLEKLLASKSA